MPRANVHPLLGRDKQLCALGGQSCPAESYCGFPPGWVFVRLGGEPGRAPPPAHHVVLLLSQYLQFAWCRFFLTGPLVALVTLEPA